MKQQDSEDYAKGARKITAKLASVSNNLTAPEILCPRIEGFGKTEEQ